MCGIAGFVGQGNKEILRLMTGEIKHRGPDSEGFFIKDDVFFGHRRLSIIDLSAGAQPMFNEDKSVAVVFNGEIYNFKDLRKQLFKHSFKTLSDTEVIVHGFEEWGEKVFEKLNGMFAVAIWDDKNKKLILGRDRFGEKPLYWSKIKDTVIFASEIKSILKHPLISKKLNLLSVYRFFSFDYIPQPHTIFNNIFKLENGSFLITEKGKELRFKKFYEIEIAEKKNDFNLASNNLEKLLADSVALRLVADVPVGIFLSGGIDSSVIAYFAKREKDDIKTISVGFEEKSFDESFYAKKVSSHLRTEHFHKNFTSKEMIKAIPEVMEKLDEPFGDPSIMPSYLLSKFAREKVKVVLGGDGGDELFMGYPNHRLQKALHFIGLNRLVFKTNYAKILKRILPVSDKNLTFFYKIQRYGESLNFPPLFRDFFNIGSYFQGIHNLFRFQINSEEPFDFADDFLKKHEDKNYLERISLLFQKYYLEDDILFKVDRASMYNGLEARAPFLDTRLADFVNSLPCEYKLRRFKTKHILKELMENKLPKEIIRRKKKGFGVPLAKWLKKELKDYMLEMLAPPKINKFGLLKYEEIEKLIYEHLNGKKDNRKIIWNLIIFQNWCDKYLG